MGPWPCGSKAWEYHNQLHHEIPCSSMLPDYLLEPYSARSNQADHPIQSDPIQIEPFVNQAKVTAWQDLTYLGLRLQSGICHNDIY